jgi:hypothetical protein
MALPYPPPYQDIDVLCQHLSVSPSTVEAWVKLGLLPPPRGIGGHRLWKWAEVERCIDGKVYFLEAGDLIKIGFSRDLRSRIGAILASLPFPSVLLHSIVGTERMERYFHNRFATFRVRKEWFRKEPRLIEYIEGLKRGGVPGMMEP